MPTKEERRQGIRELVFCILMGVAAYGLAHIWSILADSLFPSNPLSPLSIWLGHLLVGIILLFIVMRASRIRNARFH